MVFGRRRLRNVNLYIDRERLQFSRLEAMLQGEDRLVADAGRANSPKALEVFVEPLLPSRQRHSPHPGLLGYAASCSEHPGTALGGPFYGTCSVRR